MKQYIVAIILFFLGISLLVLKEIMGTDIAPNGILIEAFWMIPMGYLSIMVSIILATCIFFFKKRKTVYSGE